MAQTQAVGPELLIPPAKSAELKALIMAKPQARYVVPTALAVGNRIGGVFAAVSWANRQNYVVPDAELKQLIDAVKSEADRALSLVGVTSSFTGTQTAAGSLSVTTTVTKGTTNQSFTFTFAPATADFSPQWSEMKTIASARWERFVRTLTDADVKAIFELAKLGYRQFLTGNSAAEQKARVKHAIAMERIKAMATWYRQRLDPLRYDVGYGTGAAKYKELAQNIAYPAILYGFEYAKAVVQVL